MAGERRPFVGRAGAKLEAALSAFEVDPAGLRCADLGCHVGGFTDCLLRHGAARVYAVDTGYGVLDYRLRADPRVVVMERTNALHVDPPEPVDLVTVDLGWTRLRHAVPAALRWLAAGGRLICLVKPHYEIDEPRKRRLLRGGALREADARAVLEQVLESFPALGAEVRSWIESPVRGAKSARRSGAEGNVEYLVLACEARPDSA